MSLFCKIYNTASASLLKNIDNARKDPCAMQITTFEHLISTGSQSFFGNKHRFKAIRSYSDFQKQVPLHQYEDLLPYITRIRKGEKYVLWNQKTEWFAKSSGTAGTKSKYIPVTPDSLRYCHYRGMRSILAMHICNYPQSALFNGKSLTLGGSCKIDEDGAGKSRYGDLSAILLSNSPKLAEWFRTPPKSMVLQDHFEQKIEQISQYISKQNITNFSGVPSWNMVLLRKVLQYSNKDNLLQVWPKLELFIHGGISFEPYREQYRQLIPSPQMHYIETYNASEGFFAFQDDPKETGMLLLPHCGIFYEFIPLKQLPEALAGNYIHFETMESVQQGVDYAIVISTNGGLWRYLIGDTIRFTSLYPHRMIVTGRTKLFINAFGEELMIDHAEKALSAACLKHNATVTDFTVAPLFMDHRAKGAHEWLVEFDRPPMDLQAFANDVDKELCGQNSDYEAKRANNATMLPLRLHPLAPGSFYRWLGKNNKLGGQNKVPRLSGTRDYVEALLDINEELRTANANKSPGDLSY